MTRTIMIVGGGNTDEGADEGAPRVGAGHGLADDAVCASAIRQVAGHFPELTHFGFGVFDAHTLSPAERAARFRDSRAAMFTPDAFDELRRAHGWLGLQRRTRQVNRRAGTSYGLKHVAERAMGGYIANGMFIAAAVARGFVVRRAHGGPNAYLGISQEAVRLGG